jgi:pantoate--beta-alanine ligase
VLRERVRSERDGHKQVGLVPTMGALHAGHVSLLQRARDQNDFVVVSIFVNPLQFERPSDLARYPRTITEDLRICAENGVDLVFAPNGEEIYPSEPLTFVEVPALAEHLCGQFRPGHFRGVATVVLKLFQIVQPDRAYFGRKDAQQLAIIRRMVDDLNVPLTIVPVETVREPDGLALSSRNKHLTAEERQVAPVLYHALSKAVELLNAGERSVETIHSQVQVLFKKCPSVRVEYFEITDPARLVPVKEVTGPVLVAGAIWLGNTRLIDNLSFPGGMEPGTSE